MTITLAVHTALSECYMVRYILKMSSPFFYMGVKHGWLHKQSQRACNIYKQVP